MIPDFRKPPKKEPVNSVFLVDMILEKWIFSKKLNEYRAHSACVLDKEKIYVLGGQLIGGEWSRFCSILSISDKDLIETELPSLTYCLVGPSSYILDSIVYIAGLDFED